MKKEYSATYQILKSHHLILEKHKGMIDGVKLAKFLQVKELDKNFSADYDYLVDLRETSFSKNVQKVQDFVSYFRNNHKNILTHIAD